MKRIALFLWMFLGAGPLLAQGWYEPQRGTAERAALMDALRPYAEYVLGPPVQFVVQDLRVSGNLAYTSLRAQRPGGGAIDPYRTPAYARGEYDPQAGQLTRYHALLVRSAAGWQVQFHSVDAQDVWWSDPRLCAQFAAVTPEVC